MKFRKPQELEDSTLAEMAAHQLKNEALRDEIKDLTDLWNRSKDMAAFFDWPNNSTIYIEARKLLPGLRDEKSH